MSDKRKCRRDSKSNSFGFGLVEIMVGLAVGVVSMLVIVQVYSAFEGQKRTTTTGSDAQTNGALALYLMEREIRVSGYGLTEGEPQKYPPLAGCTTKVFQETPYLVPNNTYPFASSLVSGGTVSSIRLAPVVVSDGGAANRSDSITLVYGTSPITVPYTLVGAADNYIPTNPRIQLTSANGIAVRPRRDMVALIEENSRAAGVNYIQPKLCSLLQVTRDPDASLLSVTADRNGLAFASDSLVPARLYNLGQVNVVTFRIGTSAANGGDGNLVADVTQFGDDPERPGTAVVNRVAPLPIASNIVNMQVQYGIDTGNSGASCDTNSSKRPGNPGDADGIVDRWVDATGVWANNGVTTPSMDGEFNLRRIRAVRIALVARSEVMAEVPPDGQVTQCTTTPDPPAIAWNGVTVMSPDLSGDPAWRCYRYSVFQATVPIKNAIWSRTMNPASAASCNG